MKGRDLTLIAIVSLCVAIAIGCGFYLLSGGTASVFITVAAILALALAQITILVQSTINSTEQRNKIGKLHTHQQSRQTAEADSRRQTEFILNQLSELRSEASRHAALVTSGFAELKNSYAGLAETLLRPAPILPPAPAIIHVSPVASAEILPDAPPQQSFGEALSVALEPIIDLHKGRTAHYRVHLSMKMESGEELTNEGLLHYADRAGIRSKLDIFVAREITLLLRRLRERDPNLILFMPIGASTLADHESLGQIISDRQIDFEMANGLAMEIPHAMLAGLSDQALEGLATLARQGITLALSNASVAGLDLNALATLNVRYVGLEMGSLGEPGKPSAALIGFGQVARASHVHLIVTGVTNPQLISSLPQIARFAAGPCFAPPRRVKREIASQVNRSFTAAA